MSTAILSTTCNILLCSSAFPTSDGSESSTRIRMFIRFFIFSISSGFKFGGNSFGGGNSANPITYFSNFSSTWYKYLSNFSSYGVNFSFSSGGSDSSLTFFITTDFFFVFLFFVTDFFLCCLLSIFCH